MSAGWSWQPARLQAELEALGYDVDATAARLDGGGSLVARRDRGVRSHVVALDAGGRFRGTVMVSLREARRQAEVAGVRLRVVTETLRTVTITGTLSDDGQLPRLLERLDRLAPAERERAEAANEGSGEAS